MKSAFLICMLAISALAFSNPIGNITRILNSGDGKSHKTAYEVYTIEEEYQLLEHLKLNPEMQMLSFVDGQYYDIIIVGETSIYFKLIRKPKADHIKQLTI